MFLFSSIKLEPEILNCQNRKRCSRVLYLQEGSDLQLARSSSIAIAFEKLNGEGGDTTVFAPGTPSARLSTIRQHINSRSGRLGSR